MKVPGHMMKVPGHMMKVPGHMMKVPGHMMKVPGHMMSNQNVNRHETLKPNGTVFRSPLGDMLMNHPRQRGCLDKEMKITTFSQVFPTYGQRLDPSWPQCCST